MSVCPLIAAPPLHTQYGLDKSTHASSPPPGPPLTPPTHPTAMCPFPPACRSLEDKAREMNISDLASFYGSNTFTGAGFQLDKTQNVIAYHV